MNQRQQSIARLCRSMGYHPLPEHAAAIDELAARLIEHRHAHLLDAANGRITTALRRRIEDEFNPTLRNAVRCVMERAIAQAVTAAPRHND